jgi:hypothetical protein
MLIAEQEGTVLTRWTEKKQSPEGLPIYNGAVDGRSAFHPFLIGPLQADLFISLFFGGLALGVAEIP